MGKKSRRKRNKTRFKAFPDESFAFGPVRIERYGRFLRFSNRSTPEEHEAFLKRSEETNKHVFKQLEDEVPALQRLVERFDPIELLHRAAYELLPLFIKYRSENEYSPEEGFSLPAVEYLQYLVARANPNTDGRRPSEEEWKEVWEKALQVLQLTQTYLFTRKTLASPPSETDELRFLLDSRRLAVRVRRYPNFLADYLTTSLAPYEQWLKEIYGVGSDELIEGLKTIEEYQRTGVLDRYRDVISAQEPLIAKLREKGYAVDPGSSPQEVKRTQRAIQSEEFKDLRNELQEYMRLTFTPAIFDITDLTRLPKQVLALLSVKPGEAILTKLTGPGHDDLSPLSTSVLHYKPFVEVDGRFYTFYHSGFEDRMAEIIEADLFQQRPGQITVMAKKRSDRIETDAKALLTSLIKPDFAYQNVYYPNPDEAGGLTELDILLGVDDILFLVEVKAGGFSDPAARGAPKSLEAELSDLIIEGQRQSERAEKYIKSNEEAAFFDETGRKEIVRIRQSDFRKTIRIVITREDLGWVGARIATLSVLDPNLSKSFPWHISIEDLRIVAELFQDNELRFLHFLEQRLEASSEATLFQHDEIEHIALYNKINHYHQLPVEGMNHFSYDASYMRDIDYYFMDKVAGDKPPIPTQEMPTKMRAFVDALRDSHLPGRFEASSLVLSMDDSGRDEFEGTLNELASSKREGRPRTARMPFTSISTGLSVTYAGEDFWSEELKRSAAQMEQSRCERWVVVQLDGDPTYQITHIERITPGIFSPEELTTAKVRLEDRVKQVISSQRIGRNDRCPCGSDLKYKRCHGR